MPSQLCLMLSDDVEPSAYYYVYVYIYICTELIIIYIYILIVICNLAYMIRIEKE